MLRRFPGRTLDELDQMDWLRFWRAIEAERIEQLEDRRSAFLAGKLKDLPAEDWEQIAEHETWID